MKFFLRVGPLLLLALLAFSPSASAQRVISKIAIEHVGPPAASDSLIRANIRSKQGEPLSRATVDEDVKNLYATGFFYEIRVAEDNTSEGIKLTYVVQGKPLLNDIRFLGNKKYSNKKLLKKVK